MKKVLIATPALDGRLDVWYTNSVINAVRFAQSEGVFLHPIFLSFEALIQRARNDLVRLAVEGDYDAMIFIDSDMEFDPQWIMEMINREEDIIGGTCRKKTDEAEIYVVKTDNLNKSPNGLIKVTGLGTGFVKLSKKAFTALWENSEPYMNEGRECRMVCDVKIIDGQLVSEDIVLFKKLSDLGFDIWLDPRMTCNHIGIKKYVGSFEKFINSKQLKKVI